MKGLMQELANAHSQYGAATRYFQFGNDFHMFGGHV